MSKLFLRSCLLTQSLISRNGSSRLIHQFRCYSLNSIKLYSQASSTSENINTQQQPSSTPPSEQPNQQNSDLNSAQAPQQQEQNSTQSQTLGTSNLQIPLNLDSAETLKQKREQLQKELEARKDAEVMLKKVIYRGIRAFGVLFVAVCLLIWAVKKKNLEAKVRKFNEKIKRSEEKEKELEKDLEENFSYIRKDIENQSKKE
ncbi:hypothetical protein FDP41_002306 [Naegleria fowleri]|uniref:Transmembrane protein n=1 Tax=Naegleria fowleri TaxID=5763 RepID=A0A6A5BTF9_NAEFO|nr:uncharacterized protein FDP41_002306 [Naegleria fowleri]KAF0978486.1 hypothetical protein FDP41_002306 [Naegleria fowleri]